MKYSRVPYRIIEKNDERIIYIPDSMFVCQIEDGQAGRFIDSFETIDSESLVEIALEIGLSEEELRQLIAELVFIGLFRKDNGDGPQIRKHPTADKRSLPPYIAGVWLAITDICNLRCNYCSADFGTFGQEAKGNMSVETAQKSLDLLFDSFTDIDVKKGTKVLVCFIGGEPLLNMDLIEWCVDYATNRAQKIGLEVSFALNTNGTLLNEENLSFFKSKRFMPTISIDGPENVHNSSRCYVDGRGSYLDVERGMTKIVEKSGRIRAQSACVKPEDLGLTVKHLYGLGVRVFVVNPVFNSPYTETNYKFDEEFRQDYIQAFKKTNEKILKKNLLGEQVGFGFILDFMRKLNDRCVRLLGCGAGASIGVSVDGDIYPCQSLIGAEKLKLGNVHSGIDMELRSKFYHKMLSFCDKCQDCYARNLCGGACYAIPYLLDDVSFDFPSDRCDLYKAYVDESIWMYSKIVSERPEFFNPLVVVQEKEGRKHD